MKTLCALLMVLSVPAWGAWTQVDADNLRTTFADPGTISKEGDRSRMASLVEFSRFQRMVEVGYFSQKFLHEYDCAKRRVRRLSQVFHAGHMADGAAIYADESAQEWEPVGEGSAAGRLLEIACR